MKRDNPIVSLFQRHEVAKVKKIGPSSSPTATALVVVEGHTQEHGTVAQEHGTVAQEQEVGDREERGNQTPTPPPPAAVPEVNVQADLNPTPPQIHNVELIPHDPGKRKPIASYPINDQDAVRRRLIARGPCQPRKHNFRITEIAGRSRQFCSTWFDKYPWIEYSVELDAAFCLFCYLFKDQSKGTNNSFVKGGWSNWNKCQRLDKHEGGIKSIHNQAQEKYNLFRKQESSISNVMVKISQEDMCLYIARLTHSIRCVRFILHQGLALRGHDESAESSSRGNFLELLTWLAQSNEEIDKIVLKNAPGNCILTCHSIQSEIMGCCALETTRRILEEIGDDPFAILADESSDASFKEQLALCLRYIDRLGRICEHFLGIIHVADTTSLSLKEAIENLLSNHGLTLTQIRGQGYDGASNMKGQIKRLKTLIMKESPSAYYIHCFAHQLQLVLIAVAKNNVGVLDSIQQELDNRFDEDNMELLICMAALNPVNAFASYDREKVLKLAKFYPNDFSQADFIRLPFQLDTFIDDMRKDDRFMDLKNLGELSVKLVETKKSDVYRLVYLLLKLVLVLPVATASVERVFSAMNLVKNKLRNSMCDQMLNDCLVTFIEKDIFMEVPDADIVKNFMALKTRRVI